MSFRYWALRAISIVSAFMGLSACGNADCSSNLVDGGGNGVLGDSTLSGQIDNWQNGDQFTLQATFFQDNNVFATSSIDAFGNFSITLPNNNSIISDYQIQHLDSPVNGGPTCSGCVTVSPQDYIVATLSLTAVKGFNSFPIYHGTGEFPSVIYTNVDYIYADRELVRRGQLTCPDIAGLTSNSVTDIRYQPGWNAVVNNSTVSQNIHTTTSISAEPPVDLKWMVGFPGP